MHLYKRCCHLSLRCGPAMKCPCSCFDFCAKLTRGSSNQNLRTHSRRSSKKSHRKQSPGNHHRKKTVSISKPRQTRIKGYSAHFFCDHANQVAPSAHRLTSIAAEDVLNFVQLPVYLRKADFPPGKLANDVIIVTPEEYF